MGLQSFMRHFSIRLRMLGAIAVVIALLCVVGGAGLFGLNKVKALGHEFSEHAFAETVALSRLRLALADLSRYEKDMVIHYESPEQLSLANMKWEKKRAEIGQHIATMLQGEEDGDNAILREMEAQLKAYSADVEPVVANIKTGNYDSATVANRMLGKAHDRYDRLLSDMQKVEAVIGVEAKSLLNEQDQTTRNTMLMFGVAVGIAMLIVVPTTLTNMQSICRPLDGARALASAIAQGDLTRRVEIQGRDELTALMEALGSMQSSLGRIVGEVRATTNQIAAASSDIASGNQDLSSRTENAASQLQQTASSIDQLNGMVSQSTTAANDARDKARANAEVAQRGGAVVGQVVSTMEEIRRSSQKIHDIIGVIDGIAFQTNILALNAAVEAARAGEQGRGFAVVAGEVRRLAQSSAEAAQEIKQLIGASVERVEAGTRLVGEAGSTIGEVVTNAQRVADMIGEITAASGEQSSGIAQVNTAVNQLDQMTQQNAALVEQSAAATQSLKDQAQRLVLAVQVFKA